jgi:hypothetical protein
MAYDLSKETAGAWIIHHGRKVALDVNGASEFPVIDEAAKAASLLSRLGASEKSSLSKSEVVTHQRQRQDQASLSRHPSLQTMKP